MLAEVQVIGPYQIALQLSGDTGAHAPSPDGWNASPHHGGTAGNPLGSAISRLGAVSRETPGVARSSKLVLGFWARAKPASKETRWSRRRSESMHPSRGVGIMRRPIIGGLTNE